jgi:radical SAM superfamily enzyme YgiQ (UPF0313 family)
VARVLLINLASLPMRGNDPIFPIGARCIEDALIDEGHTVELMDFVERPEALDDLKWVNANWDVIGFAIRNIDPIDLACDGHVLDYERFVTRVRNALDNSCALLVVGGPGYSLFAETLLNRLKVHVGVIGPGEVAMINIANDPERYLGSKTIITGERYPKFVDKVMSHPPSLMRAYVDSTDAMIGVETLRRTCFQKCVYCPYAYISGKNSGDFKSIETLAAEIDNIYSGGFKRIFFTDAIFNSQRAAKPIVKMLSGSDFPDLTWSAYFSPQPFDDEFANLLAHSGAEHIVVSPDSLDSTVMRLLGKNFDLASVERFIIRCRKHGLRAKVNIVFGGPGETRETVSNTARFANEMLYDDELSMHVGYRILPETELARQTGLTESELISPTFYPIDEDIVHWVIASMDDRFLTTSIMLNLFAGRASARRMSKLSTSNPIEEDKFSYTALSRASL